MLIFTKFDKNTAKSKIRISGRRSLYPAGNHLRPIISCSLGPGDAFCTVARLRNSFSDDFKAFEKFASENDCKFGNDPNSWNILRVQNILRARKMFSENPVGSEVSLNIWFYGVLSTLKTLPRKSEGERGLSPPEADSMSFSQLIW